MHNPLSTMHPIASRSLEKLQVKTKKTTGFLLLVSLALFFLALCVTLALIETLVLWVTSVRYDLLEIVLKHLPGTVRKYKMDCDNLPKISGFSIHTYVFYWGTLRLELLTLTEKLPSGAVAYLNVANLPHHFS